MLFNVFFSVSRSHVTRLRDRSEVNSDSERSSPVLYSFHCDFSLLIAAVNVLINVFQFISEPNQCSHYKMAAMRDRSKIAMDPESEMSSPVLH